MRLLFQGKLNGDVRARGDGPHFVSLQAGAWRADQIESGSAPVETFTPRLDASAIRQMPDSTLPAAGSGLAVGTADVARVRASTELFAELGVAIDADDPVALMVFPEMDPAADVPEITEACWGILGKSPESVMCATSRMVVKRKGAARPAVIACTLLPYDPRFELGRTLAEAGGAVPLNHPHCAKFCVLGGGACSRG